MPKLSTYVQQQEEESEAAQRPQLASSRGDQPEQQASASSQPQPQQLPPKYGAAVAKLRDDYAKRLENHGPRTFRWPDGTLRPEKPPPNPYVAANRQKWEGLVRHCRTHGGDRGFDKNGYSLRYGINVSPSEHAAYLQLIGLQPDVDDSGRQRGLQPGGPQNPLDDPDHCFNTFYKEGAAAVFKHRRGRLL